MQATPRTSTPETLGRTAQGPPAPGAPLRVGILGARTAVQGIGPYVARAFARAGCRVCAVAGTSAGSARAAAEDLARRFDLRCTAHVGLQRMLEDEPLDVLAVCSPMGTHREALAVAGAAGVHVLCEKPLWWEAGCRADGERLAGEVAAVARDFVARGKLLALNTQWPTTLPAWRALFPAVASTGGARRFEMLMSPKGGPHREDATPERLVVDAAPHALAMLRALVGGGRVEAARATRPADEGPGRAASGGATSGRAALDLTFTWRHAAGATEVLLRLRQCPEQPRPAGYGIDGAWVGRRVALPEYAMSLVTRDGRSAPLTDPLDVLVAGFAADAAAGRATDIEGLVESMTALRDLVAVTEGSEDSA
jgi:predicted dehydrogenase